MFHVAFENTNRLIYLTNLDFALLRNATVCVI
jgi:hypothetical protein